MEESVLVVVMDAEEEMLGVVVGVEEEGGIKYDCC